MFEKKHPKCPTLFNNLPLPYVNEIQHLGDTLQSKDISCKRAISKIHSLNQEFHYANTSTVLWLYDIYILVVSMTQISGIYTVGMFKNVLNSWNIPIRILSYLLYFIEPIYNVSQIKTVYALQFVTSLSNCHKLCIRLLIDLSKHDLRTVLFKNLESIAQDCNLEI